MANAPNQEFPPAVMPSLERQTILTGQKALVTGASSGIGLQTAIALGHAGADVVVNYVSGPDKAEKAVQEIKRRAGQAGGLAKQAGRERELADD